MCRHIPTHLNLYNTKSILISDIIVGFSSFSGSKPISQNSKWVPNCCIYEVKHLSVRLQALLLHGSLPEEDQDGSVSLGDTRPSTEQQLVQRPLSANCLCGECCRDVSTHSHLILSSSSCPPPLKVLIRSRLDQSTEETLDLKVLYKFT